MKNLLIIAVLISSNIFSEVTILGIGSLTCEQMDENLKQNEKGWKPILQSWAQGYITGLNQKVRLRFPDYPQWTPSPDEIYFSSLAECAKEDSEIFLLFVFEDIADLAFQELTRPWCDDKEPSYEKKEFCDAYYENYGILGN